MPEPEERKSRSFESGYRGYIAGVIDCDGSIFVTADRNAKRELTYYTLRISVSNTRAALPQWFAGQFGGIATSHSKPGKNHKAEWRWSCANNSAADVIRCCLPYLVIKRQQALLGLEFATTVASKGKHLPQSFRDMRVRIYNQMTDLNKRGPL